MGCPRPPEALRPSLPVITCCCVRPTAALGFTARHAGVCKSKMHNPYRARADAAALRAVCCGVHTRLWRQQRCSRCAAKPAWAISEKQADALEEEELNELLAFAER
jgi:hypothetical protein